MHNSIVRLFDQVLKTASKQFQDLGLFNNGVEKKVSKSKHTVSHSPTIGRRFQSNDLASPQLSQLDPQLKLKLNQKRAVDDSERSYVSGEENIDSSRHSTLKPHQVVDPTHLSPSQLLSSVLTSHSNDLQKNHPHHKTVDSRQDSLKDMSETSSTNTRNLPYDHSLSISMSRFNIDTKPKRNAESAGNTQSPIRRSQVSTLNASRYVFNQATGTLNTTVNTSGVASSEVHNPKDAHRSGNHDKDLKGRLHEYTAGNKRFSKTFRPLTSSSHPASSGLKPNSTPKSESFKVQSNSRDKTEPNQSEEQYGSERNRERNPHRERVNITEFTVQNGLSASYNGTPSNQPTRPSTSGGTTTVSSTSSKLAPSLQSLPPRRGHGKDSNGVTISTEDEQRKSVFENKSSIVNSTSGGTLSTERTAVLRAVGSPNDRMSGPIGLAKGVAKNVPLQSSSKVKMEGDMDYFKLNGIRRMISLENSESVSFFKLLEFYPKLTLFLGDFVKASSGSEETKSPSKNEARMRRILILTRGNL